MNRSIHFFAPPRKSESGSMSSLKLAKINPAYSSTRKDLSGGLGRHDRCNIHRSLLIECSLAHPVLLTRCRTNQTQCVTSSVDSDATAAPPQHAARDRTHSQQAEREYPHEHPFGSGKI